MFLSFINHLSVAAVENASKMEELLYTDPSSALTKARIFTEVILEEVFHLEELEAHVVTSLFDRINVLTKEGILTPEIQNALHTVRMLGNKAAHKADYNDIVDAFKAHKAMYSIALWFYETYSTEEVNIPSYTHPQPKNEIENIEDLVKKKVLELLANHKQPSQPSEIKERMNESSSSEDNPDDAFFQLDLKPGESYLLRELRKLQDSSKEAIENADTFSLYKKYLHVNRQVQLDLEEILEKCQQDQNSPSLVLLCGSVGDGKSHLLAYLKKNRPELLTGFKIFNDATESFSPSKNSMETLQEVLQAFSDTGDPTNTKVILAINLGVLHNFITLNHEIPFVKLKNLVESSNVFTSKVTAKYQNGWLNLINFGDYQSFELSKNGVDSSFYVELLKRISLPDDSNPFYQAYKKDLDTNVRTMVHYNYELLQFKTVQVRLTQLIIQTIIKNKLMISARAFLNFVSDILIPEQLNHFDLLNDFERVENSLPILLFKRKDRSSILNCIEELNPIHTRSQTVDETVIKLNTLKHWNTIIDNIILAEKGKEIIRPFIELESQDNETITNHSFSLISEAIILLAFLTNPEFASMAQNVNYHEFIRRLYYFNTGNIKEIRVYYDEIKECLLEWNGSPQKEYVYLIKPSNTSYYLAQRLNLRPNVDHLPKVEAESLISFKSTLNLAYTDDITGELLELDIDFQLYELLEKVRKGYCPNKHDEEDAIKFIEFIDRLMNSGNKYKELLVEFPDDLKVYKLYRDDFGALVFEREHE